MRTISGISTRISKQMGQAGLLPLALATLMLASCGGGDQHRAELDLDSLDGQWDTFIRMRYGAPGEEVVSWWDGKVFSVVPGEKPEALFGIIGHNIGQVLPAEDGTYQWVSREVAYYTDLKTGEILSHWDNPWTGERVKVVDVFNDPVNGVNIRGRSPLSFRRGSDGTVMLQFDVPLEYPNPLQPEDYPESSSGSMYRASEHFLFYSPEEALTSGADYVPMSVAWTRTGPWLPWMKMGSSEGRLVYVSVGGKHPSIDDLDPRDLAHTREQHPKFMHAPTEYTTPNETSWTVYRRLAESGELD